MGAPTHSGMALNGATGCQLLHGQTHGQTDAHLGLPRPLPQSVLVSRSLGPRFGNLHLILSRFQIYLFLY